MKASRRMVGGFLMATISCNAAAIDKHELRLRYEDLKRRYQTLPGKSRHLQAVEALVSAIESAKHKQDGTQLNGLLSDFDHLITPLEQGAEMGGMLPVVKAGPVDGVAGDKASSEYQLVKALFGIPEFRALLQLKAQPRNIDDGGAAGRNIAGFSDVAAQREAGWMLLLGLMENQPAAVEKAVRAVEYAFARQHAQGYFENGLGVSAPKAINADVFFLQAYAQVYGLLKESPFAPQYLSRLDALQPKLQLAMSWLRQNTDEMRRQDGHTANRLAFDALALLLNGKLLGDQALLDSGSGFLRQVLSMQREDGVFLEKGGYDSSYQAVTLLNLQIAWTFLEDAGLRQQTFLAMVGGMNWLKSRILPNGEVSSAGNSRTGHAQEIFFGKAKEINYGEVAFALFYWSVIANDKAAEALAKNVIGFAQQHGQT